MLALPMVFTSCSNHKFKIKGEIYGGEGKSLVLEKSDFQGRWIPVDSTKTNKNGGFSMSFPSPASPDIYRLSFGNQYVYFPVDSIETITLNTSADKFGQDFSLTGSRNAEMMEQFEKELHATNKTNPDSLAAFKREVYGKYMRDFQGSILSFYILTKTIDGRPLYNPEDNNDRKYFSAVATGFQTARPEDPHTVLLEQTVLTYLKKRNSEEGRYQTLEAREISVIDMDLKNEKGENLKLSNIVGKGKPVVVVFSLLNQPESPGFNMELGKIYNRLNGKVEFYNVSLDEDQFAWREAAKNLPWINVYSPGESSSKDAINYNVFQLPSFFIYNSSGELESRPMTLEELDKSL